MDYVPTKAVMLTMVLGVDNRLEKIGCDFYTDYFDFQTLF